MSTQDWLGNIKTFLKYPTGIQMGAAKMQNIAGGFYIGNWEIEEIIHSVVKSCKECVYVSESTLDW